MAGTILQQHHNEHHHNGTVACSSGSSHNDGCMHGLLLMRREKCEGQVKYNMCGLTIFEVTS